MSGSFSLSVVVNNNGTPMTLPFAAGIEITRGINRTMDWAVTVEDDQRQLNADATSGTWAGVLNGAAYGSSQSVFSVPGSLATPMGLTPGSQTARQLVSMNTDGTPVYNTVAVLGPPPYVKTAIFSGNQSGTPFTWPIGVPNKYGYKLSPEDPDGLYTWAGRGVMARAYDDEQNMPYVSTQSGSVHVNAQQVLAYIANYLGVPFNVSGVTPWPLARRQMATGEKAVAHLGTQEANGIQGGILGVKQAVWIEQADGVVCIQPNYSSPSFSRTYNTTAHNIREVSGESSAAMTRNQCVANRADDMGGVLATVSQNNGTFGNHYTATWSTPAPVSSLNIKIRSQVGGTVSDFWFYSGTTPGQGNPCAVLMPRSTAPPLSGATTAQSVQFTLGSNQTVALNTSTTASFSVEIRSADQNVYLDNVVSVTRGVPSSYTSGRGIRTIRLGPNPMICDGGTLTNWADLCLYKLSCNQKRWTGTLDLDPWLEPGTFVSLYDAQIGVTHALFLESVHHSIKPGWKQRTTTFEAVEYVL